MKCREAEEKLRHLEMTNGQVKDRKKAFQFSSQNLTRGFPPTGTRGEMQGSRGEAHSVREDEEGLPGFKSNSTTR